MNYQQTDPRWATKPLGTSGLDMAQAGCFVTCGPIIRQLQGYTETPGDVCDYLDTHGGFTPDGNAYWAGMEGAMPGLSFGGSGFQMVQGHLANTDNYHWWVRDAAGNSYDPWTGTSSHPNGYLADGTVISIGCTKAPVVISVIDASAPIVGTKGYDIVLTARLNFRSAPHLNAPVMVTYDAGTVVSCKGAVTGDIVNNNNRWYESSIHGWFCTAEYATIQATNQL